MPRQHIPFVLRAVVVALLILPVVGCSDKKPTRDRAQRSAFQRTHPCPANGHTKGACPGYQVDHIVPLKCGGRDAPDNMQWLSVDDHKAKTANQAKACR